jgi:hypothetical protein
MKKTILALSVMFASATVSQAKVRASHRVVYQVPKAVSTVMQNDTISQTMHIDGQLYGRATKKRMSRRARKALIIAGCVVGAVIVLALVFWAGVGLLLTGMAARIACG